MKSSGKTGKNRLFYTMLFLLFTAVEVLIAVFVYDKFVRSYVGDMLVVIVIYCFVRIFIPKQCRKLPLYIFLFAVAVEVLQYFHLADFLPVSENRFFRILLGSVFDWKDIACYAVGCGLLWAYELFFLRRDIDKER